MLTNLLTYFSNATPDEGLQAACFNIAAERYLDAKFNGEFNDNELSAIAIKIAQDVRRELI